MEQQQRKPDDPLVIWEPHRGSQRHFLSCPAYEALFEGERGPGKTDALLMDFAQNCQQGHGYDWRGVLFGREYKHLDEVVIKSKKFFHRIFPEARWIGSKDQYKWVWPDGEELLLRRMKSDDEYWDYHGHEYPWIGWEELTKWPNDNCYEIMKSCSRSTNPNIPRKYRSTCNPFGAGHNWVKRRFIDIGPPLTVVTDKQGLTRCRIHGKMGENTHLMVADPQYRARIESIQNPELRKAWLDGDWNIVVGGFLQGVWNNECIVRPFKIPIEWKHWRALDWGYARPYSVGWYCMDPDTRVIYRYRELYGWGEKENVGTREAAEEVADKILDMERQEIKAGVVFQNNPADSAMWASTGGKKVDGRELTIGELFGKKACKWRPAKKGPGSRVVGAQILVQMLKNGKFKVFGNPENGSSNQNPHFIRTVPVIMPDEKNWEDVDTEMEDHVWDEVRYSLVSRHRPYIVDSEEEGPKPGTFDWLISYDSDETERSPYRPR